MGIATKGKYKTTTTGCSVSLSWRMQVYAMPENIAEQIPISIKVREIRSSKPFIKATPAKGNSKVQPLFDLHFFLEKDSRKEGCKDGRKILQSHCTS